jgi:hypothetical protein
VSKQHKSYPWVLLVIHPTNHLFCSRCGRAHELNLPQPVWAVSALSVGFEKEHRGCKKMDGGEFCEHCSKQGHAPEECLKLVANSPREWLRGPDTGISSKTIYRVMTGDYGSDPFGHGLHTGTPLDPSDFGRCYRLLQRFPEWRSRMHEVSAKYPEWTGLVRAWPKLEALYEDELPSGRMPRLYRRMREI